MAKEKKIKDISIAKLESIMKPETILLPLENLDDEIVEDADMVIHPAISFQNMLEFVADVVDLCVDKESGDYYPHLMDFAIRYNVLTRYANFRMPEDPAKRYDLCYRTNAYWQVLDNIDINQFNEIKKAINQQVDHKVRLMESAATAQLNELTYKMNSFMEATEQMFGSEDNMMEMMKTVFEGKIDEEKLVKSVFDHQLEQDKKSKSPALDNVIELKNK